MLLLHHLGIFRSFLLLNLANYRFLWIWYWTDHCHCVYLCFSVQASEVNMNTGANTISSLYCHMSVEFQNLLLNGQLSLFILMWNVGCRTAVKFLPPQRCLSKHTFSAFPRGRRKVIRYFNGCQKMFSKSTKRLSLLHVDKCSHLHQC